MSDSFIFTYETRVGGHPFFREMTDITAKVEHELYVHVVKGGAFDQAAKKYFMEKFGLSSRYYNGIVTILQGKIKGVTEGRKYLIEGLEERIAKVRQYIVYDQIEADELETAIRDDIGLPPKPPRIPPETSAERVKREKAEARAVAKKDKAVESSKAETATAEVAKSAAPAADNKPGRRNPKLAIARARLDKLLHRIHNKKRMLASLEQRKAGYELDLASPAPPMCFGSRTLFKKQFNLKAAGYRDHAEWLKDWRTARQSQFIVPGSHEEVSGNKTCKARVAEDGSLTLELSVPAAMRAIHGPHVIIENVRFGYGHAEIVRAVNDANGARPEVLKFQAETKRLVGEMRDAGAAEKDVKEFRKKRNDDAAKARVDFKAAITWRFMRDDSGWFASVTINRLLRANIVDFVNGAIGVDVNVGFLSVMPLDGSGNPLPKSSLDLPFDASGLDSERAKAIMGEAVKTIVTMALVQRRPIVVEDLDLAKKKSALREVCGPRLARKLSGFAYKLFLSMLISRAARYGVRVVKVNPAYTSHMGRCKYADQLGITVHRAAAAMIARRGMGLSEGLYSSADVPVGDGSHVALRSPVRMGRRHVWKSWGGHFGRYKAARKAHFAASRRAGRSGRGEGRRAFIRSLLDGEGRKVSTTPCEVSGVTNGT